MDPALLITTQIFVALIMLVGVVALIFPVFPGLVIIWAGAILYGLVVGFSNTGWTVLIIMTILLIIGMVLDYVIMGAALKQGGAAWISIILAMVAGVVGTFVFPPFGGLVAAPLVLFLVEWLRLREWRLALNTSRHFVFGISKTTMTRLGLGLIMIILWGGWAFIF